MAWKDGCARKSAVPNAACITGRAGTKARSKPRSTSAAQTMLAIIQIQPATSSGMSASGATAKATQGM